MALQYDYESDHSRRALSTIRRSLAKRQKNGATQKQIAIDAGMTTPTVSRYLTHLIALVQAHVAGKTASPAGGKAVLYKPGPDPNYTPRHLRRKEYKDLPLAFFRSTIKMSIDKTKSPFFPAIDYRPNMVGPFECKLVEAEDGKEHLHFRWWDGARWSFPLPYDPDLDDCIGGAPAEDQFIQVATEEELVEEHLSRFAWRGYNHDQEPL